MAEIRRKNRTEKDKKGFESKVKKPPVSEGSIDHAVEYVEIINAIYRAANKGVVEV